TYGRKIPFWQNLLRHNLNDSYWERSNFQDDLESLTIPVFLQGGWFGASSVGLKHNYAHLRVSESPYVKLVIGPWEHSDGAFTPMGGNDLGESAPVELYELFRRWFDFWLREAENGITAEPAVQLYTLNLDRWLTAETYPLPGTSYAELHLASEDSARVSGRLMPQPPDSGAEFDGYLYDPGDPTPPLWLGAPIPYGELSKPRKDILVYDTEPLEDTLYVAGPVSLVLYASTSASDTDWFAYWRILESDGEERVMGGGGLRARFRDSWSRPALLEESRIYEYTLDLSHVSVMIPSGARIRLEIASAAYPWFSRNLNTGGHNELETEYVVAEQRIYHSEAYPSRLILPLVERQQYE
ncbi:MAG: CocE/NonD family hydrolase, partial [Gemmatimonadota bacterium]